MSINITYVTSVTNNESREVTDSLRGFLSARHPTLSTTLIELLVEEGVLSVEAVYEKFKKPGDCELKESIGD